MSIKVNNIFFEIKETFRFRWVVYSLISSTLKMRYKRSFLGLLWSILGPLLNYVIMGFVISKVGRFNTENYISSLLMGSLTFNFISTSFNLGGMSLIHNEHYIKKIYLPKLVFPLSIIGMEFVNFILGFSGLIIVLASFNGISTGWSILSLPLTLIFLFLFTLGIGSVLSVVNIFFRDISHVVPILMQASFFITPIIYPLNSVPEEYRQFLPLNPYFHYIELIRQPLINDHLNTQSFIFAFFLSIISLSLGLFVIKKFENKVVFKL